MSYPAGGNFLRLHCGVKQWVYTSVATKLCCSGAVLCCAVLYCAVLCGAVLLCYCSSTLLELQHELLHHGVDPRGDTAGMCATCLPWPFSRTYLHAGEDVIQPPTSRASRAAVSVEAVDMTESTSTMENATAAILWVLTIAAFRSTSRCNSRTRSFTVPPQRHVIAVSR